MSSVFGVGFASAHPGDHPHETDEQHAAQDLAGVPMTKIEKDTEANAAAAEQATGNEPGGQNDEQQVPNERVSIAAAADPGQGGSWSAVRNTPVVPVFQAVLPNGKVLMWDSVGEGPTEDYPNQSFTRAVVWNPLTNTSKDVRVEGYNIFCAGYVQLADGRLLVAGGNKNQALDGIVQTHIFDWRTETWTRGPNMNSERWYPSVAALNNGEALILGGGPSTAEVYQTNGALRQLTGFKGFGETRLYPFLVPRPNGQVELVGPAPTMNTMSTSRTGALTATKERDGFYREYGSFATYDIGKVLVSGGGDVTEDGQTRVPTKTAVVVDVNGSGSTVRDTGSMSVGRRQHNLTVLADGSVLATGGQSKSIDGLVDLQNPVFAAERWDPKTGTWEVLASASRIREYHSTAALLPDGRVLTGGGGICGSCRNQGYLEKNIEYFTPPYLYKKDGSGALAPRPVISSAPSTTGYNRQFSISSPQAGSIGKVGLVRLGAPTHGDDQGQRYVPLSFSTAGSTISAMAPANTGIAPPGYYMLFITDKNGVPSVAKMVKLDPKSTGTKVAARSDYNGDGKSDLSIWRPSSGYWHVRGVTSASFGGSGDQPVPADYGGDGRTDMAIWRPSTGEWYVRGIGRFSYGRSGDIPVPADYNGDGKADIAVWRPSTGGWSINGQPSVSWGVSGDIPVPGDYNGDGKAEVAVWRPSTNQWYVRGMATVSYGQRGDKPVASDYNGDGKTDLAIWRPSTGQWYVRGQATVSWGVSSDVPVPADYNGDKAADRAVWRPSTGQWYVRGASTVVYGQNGDIPG